MKPGWVVGNLRADKGEHDHEHAHLRRTAAARCGDLRARVPVRVFRGLRDHDPVSHHEHPVWERRLLGGDPPRRRAAGLARLGRSTTRPNPFLPGDRRLVDESGSSELLISQDPPDHTKLRKLISTGFTPRRVADLAAQVKARVDSVIDSVAERGECDLVRDIALWLPLHVIADLVGVPEEDRKQVFEWTELTFGFDADTTARSAARRRRDVHVRRRAVRRARPPIRATTS